MLNLSGKVRLGKVYSSSNYKDCYNVKVFSQGPLKLTCAKKNISIIFCELKFGNTWFRKSPSTIS